MKEIKRAAMKVSVAARYLNISQSRLRDLSDRGAIPCKRLNRERYFSVSDLDNWVANLPDWAVSNG